MSQPEALVIVESPAKAKTIGKYLGKKYMVKASMGHVRDLPKSQMGVDVDNHFQPKYITIRGKGNILKELKDSSKKVKRVFLAADPDREGEAIAWHLAHVLDLPAQEPCRVVFHEITKEAVTEAFKKPRPIDMNLVNAQQTRRILDRLVGYNISPLLWKKVRKGLSAGRVQSVAVKLIIDREREIRQFVPEEYWTVTAHLKKDGHTFQARFFGRGGKKEELRQEADVQSLLREIADKPLIVKTVKTSERRRHPAPPFTTSSLQQEAARKLNFRATRTMSVAQQLYEGIELGAEGSVGLITYMRTDSTRISDTARQEALKFIHDQYGEAYVPAKPRQYAKKEGAQDAHEAIRPTSVYRTPEAVKPYLSRDQFRLYKLIWERFVASQMEVAVLDTVTADLEAGNAVFRANGSKLKFPGFMKVYIEGTDDQTEEEGFLPPLAEGDRPELEKIEPEQHFTQPPPRYNEARLVKTMEELGIGRPSTYAPTLETIQKRGYVRLEEKRFVPTELGELVIELMEQFFPDILNVEFTAQMESNLDLIEEGRLHWIQLLDEFYEDFQRKLKRAHEEMQQVEIQQEYADETCEKCGRPMVYKHGRFGRFLACSGFPDCRFTKPIVKSIGILCPKCGGQVVERKTKKRRLFYGCSRYPDCDFVSWDRPVEKPCPKCQALMIEKKGKGEERFVQCTSCEHKETLTASPV